MLFWKVVSLVRFNTYCLVSTVDRCCSCSYVVFVAFVAYSFLSSVDISARVPGVECIVVHPCIHVFAYFSVYLAQLVCDSHSGDTVRQIFGLSLCWQTTSGLNILFDVAITQLCMDVSIHLCVCVCVCA